MKNLMQFLRNLFRAQIETLTNDRYTLVKGLEEDTDA